MDYITQVWTFFGRGMDLLFGRGGSGKKSADSPRCPMCPRNRKLSTKNGHHGHVSGLKGLQMKGSTCACFAFLSVLSLHKFQAPKWARPRPRPGAPPPRPLPNLLILVMLIADTAIRATSHAEMLAPIFRIKLTFICFLSNQQRPYHYPHLDYLRRLVRFPPVEAPLALVDVALDKDLGGCRRQLEDVRTIF